MKTLCLTCKHHEYDLDGMQEACILGIYGTTPGCTAYDKRKQPTREIADRWAWRGAKREKPTGQ